MLLVLIRVLAGNEQVINISICKVETPQHLFDEALEGLSSILQSKRHAQEFELAEWCDNGSFGDVGWLHRYLVLREHQIKL